MVAGKRVVLDRYQLSGNKWSGGWGRQTLWFDSANRLVAAVNLGTDVETNLSAAQVLNLGASVFRASPNTVKNVVAPGGVGMRSGQSVVVLGAAARTIFADMRNGRLGA